MQWTDRVAQVSVVIGLIHYLLDDGGVKAQRFETVSLAIRCGLRPQRWQFQVTIKGDILLHGRIGGVLVSLPWPTEPAYQRVCVWGMTGATPDLWLPSQLQRPATVFLPVLISRSARDRRRSWPEWLVPYRDGITHVLSSVLTGLNVAHSTCG